MSFLAVFEIEKQDAITIFSQATDKLVDMTDEDYNKTGESMSAFLNMARGN